MNPNYKNWAPKSMIYSIFVGLAVSLLAMVLCMVSQKEALTVLFAAAAVRWPSPVYVKKGIQTADAARVNATGGKKMMEDEELQFDRTCHIPHSKPCKKLIRAKIAPHHPVEAWDTVWEKVQQQ